MLKKVKTNHKLTWYESALKSVRGFVAAANLWTLWHSIKNLKGDDEIKTFISGEDFRTYVLFFYPLVDDIYNEYYSYYTQTLKKKTWSQRALNLDLERKEVGQLVHLRGFQFGFSVGTVLWALLEILKSKKSET